MRARWIWLFFGGVVVLPTLTYLAWSWRMEDLFVEAAERVRAATPPVPEADTGSMPPLLRRAALLYNMAALPQVVRDDILAAKWTATDRDEVAAYVASEENCLDVLDRALATGDGRLGRSWRDQGDLAMIGMVAPVLHARALHAGLEGAAAAALRDIRSALRLAHVVPTDSVLLFALFKINVSTTLDRLHEVRAMPGFDATAAVRSLDDILGSLRPRKRLEAAWRGERLGLVEWYETVRQDHGAIDEIALGRKGWRKWSIARPVLFGDALTSIEFWTDALRCLENYDTAGLEALTERGDRLSQMALWRLPADPARQYRDAIELEAAIGRVRASLRAEGVAPTSR